jgi:hypothetical protein
MRGLHDRRAEAHIQQAVLHGLGLHDRRAEAHIQQAVLHG